MNSFCPKCGAAVVPGAKFCAQCGAVVIPAAATATPHLSPAPRSRNTVKIALWTVGILILLAVVGMGSCTYLVGRRVHRKLLQAKAAIEQAQPAVDLDPCSLITEEELAEIYKRPFAAPLKEGNGCRYRASANRASGVSITVTPDFFMFVRAVQQYQARPRMLYGARSFFADGTLYLSYHAQFVKIQPLRGRTDAEQIAKLVLARL